MLCSSCRERGTRKRKSPFLKLHLFGNDDSNTCSSPILHLAVSDLEQQASLISALQVDCQGTKCVFCDLSLLAVITYRTGIVLSCFVTQQWVRDAYSSLHRVPIHFHCTVFFIAYFTVRMHHNSSLHFL